MLERAGFVVPNSDIIDKNSENLSDIPAAPQLPSPGKQADEEATATPETDNAAPEGTPTPEADDADPEGTPAPEAQGDTVPSVAPSSGITETILARLTATVTAIPTPAVGEVPATPIAVEEPTATPVPP